MLESIMLSFTKYSVPFISTKSFEKLIVDYLDNDDFIRKYCDFECSIEGIAEKIKTYQNHRLDRKNLMEVVFSQYHSNGIKDLPSLTAQNIELLGSSDTFTITTGHQLNLFSGPLYVILKLISAINLSEKLKELYPQKNFVPVYWMASEDHDIEEISSVNLFGKSYQWQNEWKGAAGKMPLANLELLINELKIVFGNSDFADSLTTLISKSYSESSSLAEASRKWINSLFGSYGLVVIDGNELSFKAAFKDIFIDEIINERSHSIITDSTKELKSKYYLQVNPREINLFYLGDNYRERIIREGNQFKVLNKDIIYSKDEIIQEINNHPERFSPNVLLRPVYQESILPNIAYVGGPAEIAYWLELKALFSFHRLTLPVLIHRCSVMIIDSGMKKNLGKLSIPLNDIFQPSDELIRIYLSKGGNQQIPLQRASELISKEFNQLSSEIGIIDSTLLPVIESEKQKIISSIALLEEKILRSKKKKSETEVNKIRKIKDKLFPGGKLQEREETFISFYLKWGRDFIDELKKNLNPLEKNFIILEEDSD